MASLLHEEVTEDIIGAAMAVLNELRPGLDEKIYERALIIELNSRGRHVESQKQYEVFYRGEKVGLLQPDLIVDNAVIVETKVADAFHDSHVAQVLGYLAITNLNVGLLINFNQPRLKWKRVIK
jgi:GxxExxY protein